MQIRDLPYFTHMAILAHKFERIYISYKGGCQDPGVDYDLKVTVNQRQKSKPGLVDDL